MKKLIAILFVIAMCFSVVACSSDADSKDTTKSTTVVQGEGDNNKDNTEATESIATEEEPSVSEPIKRKYVYNGFYEYRYDENGKMIEECFCDHHGYRDYKITYSPDGHVTGRVDYHYNEIKKNYVYNESGLLTDEFELDSDGDTKQITSYTYNEQDDIHKVTIDYGHKMNKYEYKYEYDANDNITKMEYYAADDLNVLLQEGDRLWYHEYTYDANGNKTEDKTVNSNGTFYEICEYDKNNNLITVKTAHSQRDNVSKIETYEYDGQGNVTAYSSTDTEDNGVTDYYNCKYDDNGNLIEAEISSGLVPTLEVPASVILNASYTYDDNNMAISCNVKEYIPSKKVTRDTVYEYVYDENMNITGTNNTFTYDYGVFNTTTDLSGYYSNN